MIEGKKVFKLESEGETKVRLCFRYLMAHYLVGLGTTEAAVARICNYSVIMVPIFALRALVLEGNESR